MKKIAYENQDNSESFKIKKTGLYSFEAEDTLIISMIA